MYLYLYIHRESISSLGALYGAESIYIYIYTEQRENERVVPPPRFSCLLATTPRARVEHADAVYACACCIQTCCSFTRTEGEREVKAEQMCSCGVDKVCVLPIGIYILHTHKRAVALYYVEESFCARRKFVGGDGLFLCLFVKFRELRICY